VPITTIVGRSKKLREKGGSGTAGRKRNSLPSLPFFDQWMQNTEEQRGGLPGNEHASPLRYHHTYFYNPDEQPIAMGSQLCCKP
jgi:hypothetical protein